MSGERAHATSDLAASLADIPKTSVHRHVGLLARGASGPPSELSGRTWPAHRTDLGCPRRLARPVRLLVIIDLHGGHRRDTYAT